METDPKGNNMEKKYLTPEQVCILIPGMTKPKLAQMRFKGLGPVFLKPTPKTVVYRETDIIAWLEGSEQSSTAAVSA